MVWYFFGPVEVKLQHVRHQLGLLFQDKSDGEVKSAVQVDKSADHLYKLADVKVKIALT